MVRTAKTGTTIAKSRRIFVNFSIYSSEAFLLTWFVYGLLPLTLTAGIGSTEVTTNGSLLSPAHQQQADNRETSITGKDNTGSDSINYYLYDCPKSCQCEYSRSSRKLEISCSLKNPASGWDKIPSPTSDQKIDLFPGVRTLRISHAHLIDAKSVGSIIPPLTRNTLVELDLYDVTIEPESFFTNSPLFRENDQFLRRLTIRGGNFRNGGDTPITDLPAASIRAVLQPLASLQNLDSLNICDSSPNLATVVLQAMPAVKHLRAVNNSLYDIPYECLTTNKHQYSGIQSIDISRNHISILPNGLLEGLTELRTLDVSHNRIFHMQEQVFTGLSALRKLNVSHNRIEYVDTEVFTPLRHIQEIDLSHNEVVQFFEPYFRNNQRLEVLNLSNMWVPGTFNSSDTATRSLMETERLIHSLNRVEKLDISDNGMRSIPETLSHAPSLKQVVMDGNPWDCSCRDRWFLDWVATTTVAIGDSKSQMWCYSRIPGSHNNAILRVPFYEHLKNLTRTCSNLNIIARTPYKYHAVMGKNKQLYCHAQKPNSPKIIWITPTKQEISENSNSNAGDASSGGSLQRPQGSQPEARVLANGTLQLSNVTGRDYGLYLCIASYENLNVTHYVHLGMDVSIFRDVRWMSIVVGWTCSFSFLLLVLFLQLVKFILNKFGIRCVSMNTSKQTRSVRAFFDSMEQHKNFQLDWLRDNYNMQARKIKDNCYSQLERIRESYASKNIGEFRDYGTQQLYTLRDQYNDQVRRVANYSAHQLCRVRENYVFKRNQVCKFSNSQLLRLRETYKWQAQTLNKILETLPRGLHFDTCRGMGACGRTESIYLDDFGEELGCLHHDVEAELYHAHSSQQGLQHHLMLGFRPTVGTADKMEHVSLLMSPDFVSAYKRTAEDNAVHLRASMKEENEEEEEEVEENVGKMETEEHQKSDEEEVVAVAVKKEENIIEDYSSRSSTSTLPTVTLESSASSQSGSYLSAESNPQPPPDIIDDANIVAITITNGATERHSDHV